MKLKKQHTPYISRKITKDIVNSAFIEVRKEKASIAEECERILNEDVQKEIELVQANLTQMSANAIESISRYTLENRVNEFYTIFKNILKVPKNDI